MYIISRSFILFGLLRAQTIASMVFVLTFSFAEMVEKNSYAAETLPDLVFVQVPVDFESDSPASASKVFVPSERYGNGYRIVSYSPRHTGSLSKNLTDDFFSACDPDVSFDGQSILFAGKKTTDSNWQIWRMDRDGSNKVQITDTEADCVSPLYVGALFFLNDATPTDQIAYLSSEHGWVNEYGFGPAYSLYVSNLEGENVHRITYNLSAESSPDVLPNGRIVFSSWNRFGSRFAPTGLFSLMAVSIDGTDLMPFYGNHEKPIFKGMVRVSYNDRVYFIESNRSTRLGGGNIAYVSLRRPLRSYRRLSSFENQFYHSPCPLPDGGLLASYCPILPGASYGIFRVSKETGQRIEEIYRNHEWHSIDTHVLAPHPRVEGRSSVVNFDVDTGIIYCLNAYTTNMEPIPDGSIKKLRVIEGGPIQENQRRFPVSVPKCMAGPGSNQYSGTLFGLRRILGVVPVEPDGSFHIEVPACTPLTFQLLDENNVAIRSQEHWTWVMPKEKRGCIGCHEDREWSPPNRLVQAIVKPAAQLTLPPERRRTVDFQHQIAPILQQKCSTANCHSAGNAIPNLDVTTMVSHREQGAFFSIAYENLLNEIPSRPKEWYVIPGKAKESPLIWHLFGKRMSSGEIPYSSDVTLMPPEKALSEYERIVMIEWVDLGAQWNCVVRDN